MSKHKSLPQRLRKQLQALQEAQITEALAVLGVKRIHLDDHYESAAQLFVDVRTAGRPARESMTHTEQFAAVTA